MRARQTLLIQRLFIPTLFIPTLFIQTLFIPTLFCSRSTNCAPSCERLARNAITTGILFT